MKKWTCGLLLLLGLGAAAQKEVPGIKFSGPHQLAVNINPAPLLNPDPRVLIGVERRVTERWALVADAGPVLGSAYIQGAQKTRGFELRPALRYYYGSNRTGYLQGQLQYRLVRYHLHDWLGKDCVNGVPTYEQFQHFTFQKQNGGAALVAGKVDRLGHRMLLDVSVGLGLTQRTQKVTSEGGCCYFPANETLSPQQEQALVPIVPISVKLAYIVR